MAIFLTFLISGAVVAFAALKIAEYGDVISVRTRLGGLLVGTVLVAGATSLPELITAASSFRLGLPELAAGTFFGSNMVNMAILATVDLLSFQMPLLRRVAVTQAVTAALGAGMMAVAVIFMLADGVDFVVGWISIESVLLIALYFWGVWLLQQDGKADTAYAQSEMEPAEGFPSLRHGVIGFIITTLVLIVAVPQLVDASAAIAEVTGLGASFIGTVLVSAVTSIPEFLISLAAVRMGATDMAVGNLFGSNVFNMLLVGVADFFYLDGSFLSAVSNEFALVGVFGILLMVMALLATLARVERRRAIFYKADAVAILVVYILGIFLLYLMGTGV